jgi:hypothetical protein
MLLPNRKGPTIEYAVRYSKGRKAFSKLEGKDPTACARPFAEQVRADGGWAEIARVTTEIVERKR